ncbi:MAG: GGDEF domain-containing protein, partial [Erysipelotrichaceae bacterium]|nr:GGDEF domain-containing protein [Erysipelotrichaceae bacterium]
QIIETASLLRSKGFHIEMDDFGTGYSSLNMISTLPIDALKLDMKFIRNAFSQKKDTRMLEVIIDIADYLSVPVIAEGVETQEQLDALKSMGCDIVQGYFFSKPVPAEEYEKFIIEALEKKEQKERYLFDPNALKHHDDIFEKVEQALSDSFDRVYYVDTDNDHFLQFSSAQEDDDLQIERSGDSFFEKLRLQANRTVVEEDRERFLKTIDKTDLLHALDSNESIIIHYQKLIDHQPHLYELKAVKSDILDDHHIAVGITDTDNRIKYKESGEISITNVIRALTRDYLSIYVVDMKTEHFTEYSSRDEYMDLGVAQDGEDFFGQTARNALEVIYPEDLNMILETVTKRNLLEVIARDQMLVMNYRLLLEGKPTYVQLKAVRMKEDDERYIVIGVTNNNLQMQRQHDQAEALRMATQDALTGVKSKYAFVEAEKKINKEIADKDSGAFAIAICDLNDLKHINDTLGHKAGDEYIKDGCRIICNIFKHSPVYRFGGDEFVVILRGNDYLQRGILVETMRKNSKDNMKNGGIIIACGMSAFDPQTDKNMDAVFERADKDMYENKNDLKIEEE